MTENNVSFGPFFHRALGALALSSQIQSLPITMEWADCRQSSSIPLFRRATTPDRTRLEHILYGQRDLPIDVVCQDDHIVQVEQQTFIPVEALLVALYRRHEVSRCIFEVLRDLESLIAIHSSVRRPIRDNGLLVPAAEHVGFHLNTIVSAEENFFADIGWKPRPEACSFHVCLAQFNTHTPGGEWKAHGAVGVCQLLDDQLHRLIPGKPSALLTEKGRHLLTSMS